ncbi:hypothetical protein AQF52_7020 [Streptomyces venezuelae]|uniref:DUF2637 domain-containing protein n=1 Tax=Streptomyces gardneri TaxID=66892 RepID=UPI0006BD4E9E|nr:DUF2637 domain-containing protein [Streptomyces gardneri]ALO12606.1 hypothetical protein AQF52_7020 [Streptomyces venezuelae]QPK49346.1 DUF2637 domain-containing protein [Streptomyces gardneri]WRK40871.1 DUF2637 domain-containing protein [Streptomyces venezuelae]CUM36758.1 FIG01125525: hypothetical protein [Streptomyces venezuelae]
MTATTAPKSAHISGWDRAAVIALGGAGCALSYDALQQMAVAIHIRGFLTYLFPLVIDGFIAYGIRALLVLRDAPLRARLYVWTLFGTATAASIWANALHAVRLNEEAVADTGLRLGDSVVAVLSTIAPLALAGAVHLYILIARKPVEDGAREDLGQVDRRGGIEVTRADRVGQRPQAGQVEAGQSAADLTDRPPLSLEKRAPALRSLTGDSDPVDSGDPVTDRPVTRPAVTGHSGQPDTEPPGTGLPVTPPVVTGRPGQAEEGVDQHGQSGTEPPVTGAPVTDREARTPGVRRSDPDTEELLKIARSAVRAEDKLTRKVVAQAIRGQQIPLSSDTLTALMAQLRQQHGQPVTSARN